MPFAVLSGSMEPDLPVGSMVFVRQVEPTDITVGDNATFYRSDGAVVTHQVYEIDLPRRRSARRESQTKMQMEPSCTMPSRRLFHA